MPDEDLDRDLPAEGQHAADRTDASRPRVARLTDPAVRPRRRTTDRRQVAAWRPGTAEGDRRLVRAASLGDVAAWEMLVGAHAGMLWAWCRTAGLRPDEARAVCELVWLRLVDALPDLGGHAVVPWLLAVTDTECAFALARARGGRAGKERPVERRREARPG